MDELFPKLENSRDSDLIYLFQSLANITGLIFCMCVKSVSMYFSSSLEKNRKFIFITFLIIGSLDQSFR